MNKFFDYSDSDTPQWFHIKARDIRIIKVITFWLCCYSELHIRDLLTKQTYKDIECIKPIGLTLPFV